MGLKPMELILILAVLLLLFGATRLPQLGSSLGSAIKNFKKGFGGEDAPPSNNDQQNLSAGRGGQDVQNKTKDSSHQG